MSLIEWRPEFEIGFAEVDADHAQLVDAINGLVHKLGESPSEALVHDVLDEIYARIEAHFALEEEIMRAHGYDQYEDHKADHEFLLDEIHAVRKSIGEGSDSLHGELLTRRVTCWFTEHFKTRDLRLHKMLG